MMAAYNARASVSFPLLQHRDLQPRRRRERAIGLRRDLLVHRDDAGGLPAALFQQLRALEQFARALLGSHANRQHGDIDAPVSAACQDLLFMTCLSLRRTHRRRNHRAGRPGEVLEGTVKVLRRFRTGSRRHGRRR